MTAVLFWDIDGTLLSTARAGLFAFEAAVEHVCGAPCALHGLATSGLTDTEVAELVLETAGAASDPDQVDLVLRSYEQHLPSALHRRRGGVLPGVIEVLTDLGERPGVSNLLLTGNTAAGGRTKLEHYGLAHFFPHGGAFSDGCRLRSEIAERAAVLAEAETNGADPALVYVIGDTPHDVACGKSIGARTVAVASGSFEIDDLAEHEPWLLLERIPSPGTFRELLDIERG